MVDRRTFLKGIVATAAGVLVPARVAAESERRIWELDRTMVIPALPTEVQISTEIGWSSERLPTVLSLVMNGERHSYKLPDGLHHHVITVTQDGLLTGYDIQTYTPGSIEVELRLAS